MIKKQTGFFSLIAIVIILIVGVVGVMVSYLYAAASQSSADHLVSTQAFYLAESGLERSTRALLTPVIANRVACASLSVSSVTDGVFSGYGVYTGGLQSPSSNYSTTPVTVNGALTAAATSIPVTGSTAGYASSGRIMIDSESINYGGISGGSFVGVLRGVDGTTAAAHVTLTRVGQDQCNIQGKGGAPSIATPQGLRTLNAGVQLQEAWAVGSTSGGAPLAVRFNGATWLTFSTAGFPAVAASGVSTVSYGDGMMALQSTTVPRWNGTDWTTTQTTTGVGTTVNSVSCASSNSCAAVGAPITTTAPANRGLVIVNWTGAANCTAGCWTRATGTNITNTGATGGPQEPLNGVSCPTTTQCYAVGNTNVSGVGFVGPVLVQGSLSGTWTWTRYAAGILPAVNLTAISCVSGTNCIAVGAPSATHAVILVGTGGPPVTWALQATSTTPNTTLNGVFCNSVADCWAVGNAVGGQVTILHGTGTTLANMVWATSANLPSPAVNVALNSITCASSSDCWAVGGSSTFLHWDGGAALGGVGWTSVSTGIAAGATLRGVSMINPNRQPRAAWSEVFP